MKIITEYEIKSASGADAAIKSFRLLEVDGKVFAQYRVCETNIWASAKNLRYRFLEMPHRQHFSRHDEFAL